MHPFIDSPVLIIEILSKSTRQQSKGCRCAVTATIHRLNELI